jgi:hypothetical protein
MGGRRRAAANPWGLTYLATVLAQTLGTEGLNEAAVKWARRRAVHSNCNTMMTQQTLCPASPKTLKYVAIKNCKLHGSKRPKNVLQRLVLLEPTCACWVGRNHHSNCNSSCVPEDMLWTI